MGLSVQVILLLGSCSVTMQQPTLFRNTYKGLRGIVPKARLPDDEMRAAYFHDQTVAVIDLSNTNQLENCNIVEVYEPSEVMEVLKNLSTEIKPQEVSFNEMTTLMRQCELLEEMQEDAISTLPIDATNRSNKPSINPLSLLFGILPGTKWCGTGDIADNYHDLGREAQIDRCCRSHDLCPVKVRAQKSRYNLTNNSIYTKSHCVCDEMLYRCLKKSYHPTADVMGRIYFNFLRVPCLEDVPSSPQGSERRFRDVKMNY
ncbi:group 3 secretory phospholipase A2 [Neodiprion lecontei]|uniref:phospholipase A2 n=1 Tax=Neodiprion lecontei TaxID=441921 RepID=A0A6J0CB65_NEOLC|nr:group 3 secretory phospholipase A2 [Neodiprion lecontei]XP_046595149.1 group 3 secretory phospholipase A2 [Neodiprion lecontei]XP_046595150.1 group 3 secretory phospholipase A2 [Neodiprion lecontei]XP_046595151.1 group 3 secretory phospholipase A2 [Neodiprion lecontei]XP_046595152.1 group 3 secretory phospholipase A2 [Neodiprion lecontei]XP_046595153.1 group 3 secretory phospholipase A2 [Neodiprion lecontei]